MDCILILEDSIETQILLRSALQSAYKLVFASSLKEAEEKLFKHNFDLMLLDIFLPDGDGFQFCEKIKSQEETENIPFMFLTIDDKLDDKLRGFKLGADDYIVKPFEPLELAARIQARLNVAKKTFSLGGKVRKGNLRFDLGMQRVYLVESKTAVDLNLTPIEFKILCLLARNDRQSFSRSELLKEIWQCNVHVVPENIYTHISSLRKKLGDYSHYLKCRPNVGYSFSTDC